MQLTAKILTVTILLGLAAPDLTAQEPIRLLTDYSLSPDGSTLIFSWVGDIWSAPVAGGAATPLTRHGARDRTPRFSPDGQEIAFVSNRDGFDQIFVMPAKGGAPEALTYHTDGYVLEEYTPSGDAFLVRATRDHFWRRGERFFRIERNRRVAPQLLFEAYGRDERLSPDGKKLLFTREGVTAYRKRYMGSQASQIWLAHLDHQTFDELLRDEHGFRSPLWKADGSGFYYVGQQSGSFNLAEYELESGQTTQITSFEDDSVLWPCISRDGSTLVFRHGFDLYRWRPGGREAAQRIEIVNDGEPVAAKSIRRYLTDASNAAFSSDGLEIAFVSGGDVWVMDTELREPRQVTRTPEEEREPVFTPDGEGLLFVSDAQGQSDIWRAERGDSKEYWWQNDEFSLRRVTQDPEVENDLRFVPGGKRISYRRGTDLWVSDADGDNPSRLVANWGRVQYDWSPDGRWIVYAISDNDFNSDIWVAPADGSSPPFNLTVHPDNDRNPSWSPDGKVIAFTGRRRDQEVDVHYIWLRREDDQTDSRDRKLAKALEKMEKGRKKKDDGGAGKDARKRGQRDEKTTSEEIARDTPEKKSDEAATAQQEPGPDLPEVRIDFEGIHDRIRRVSIPDASESGLFWLDGETLVFRSEMDGKRGLYKVKFPDELSPKLLTATPFSGAHALAKAGTLAGLSGSSPATLDSKGKVTTHAFRVRQELDTPARFRAAFDLAWRTMRDQYYDERLGNRNWDEIRRKYADEAASAPDTDSFRGIVNMMLGELNGSHLGFSARGRGRRGGATEDPSWTDTTAHLGLRYDRAHKGPGWLVRDALVGGPANEEGSRIKTGEIVLAVDGQPVDPSMDPTEVLNGPLDRDIALRIRGADGEEREVSLRPISGRRARGLLYDMWITANRKAVSEGSGNTLGYLHIRGMNWTSFLRFEEELYRVGYGKDGLVIDVRANGGGSTTDHLLTVLTQPRHAITRPRGGGEGYPQDRRVYATWDKPIVVLCDQNSFSNAEIFAHSIKTLGRGQVVGVPTAGGVISTGGTRIHDIGFLRLPFRGWYLLDGEDMELNGAVPHHIIWPNPGDLPAGRDEQLTRAVEVLLEDVTEWKERPRPTLRKASERVADRVSKETRW